MELEPETNTTVQYFIPSSTEGQISVILGQTEKKKHFKFGFLGGGEPSVFHSPNPATL